MFARRDLAYRLHKHGRRKSNKTADAKFVSRTAAGIDTSGHYYYPVTRRFRSL